MDLLKKAVPHIVAILVFVLVSVIYFSPVLEGKRIKQYDTIQFGGASKEIIDFRSETGEEALWTNSMFGGMPASQISVAYNNNWTAYLYRALCLQLPVPAQFMFIALLGFYIMLLCFKVDPWLSIAGAFAYGLSAYFLIIIGAGHNSKMRALALLPPIIGGIWLVYGRKKLLLGAIVTCLFLAMQIRVNHFQITYYTAIIVLIFMIFELIRVAKEKDYLCFLKGSAGLIVALALATGLNITGMLLTAEYTPYSTRGPSELSNTDGDKTSGLDKSYILGNYSYGIIETMDLFIPNFVGGPSASEVSHNSPFYKALIDNNIKKQQATQISKQVPLYWGGQDGGTSGPVYIGAVMIFLFVLGLFVVKGRVKWWLVAATIASVVLAWGKHCLFISDLFIDYFPGYNKFRTVSMILVIAELTIPLLGILAMKELFSDRLALEAKKNAVKKSLYIVGGIALFFVIFPGLLFNFSSEADTQYGYPDWLIVALHDTREYVLRMDALRSLFFALASAVVLWFAVGGKIKTRMVYILFALLILVDLWTVDKRYMGNDRFVAAKEVANPVKQSIADQSILQDTSLDYRVLNLGNPFNDATTSYFHKSIGGYHGAKMKRYQELIEHRLSGEMNTIIGSLQSAKTMDDLAGIFAKCPALNMLNTRYVIYNPEQPALNNPNAIGNAWTTPQIRWVDNADAEIAALNDFNPTQEAVIDKRFENVLSGFTAQADSLASIRLTDYKPNHLTYEYTASTPQLTVFSEIYYPKNWTAYIDGQPAPHVRANYVLRAMVIPEGKHQIEFKCTSSTYSLGEKISLASSIALVLLILGSIAGYFVKRRKQA
ncbi:MAG: YfhO family protein [Bacteroidales bacterium]|nr:YfhO family protein [Bacteroidales bacterium]